MNPELPGNPREELEARLTALLLGELSENEAAAVRRAIERDGELAKLFARLHHTIGLVRETAATPTEPVTTPAPPPKLSEERRQKLLAQFKTVAPREFAPEKRAARFRLLELAAVLAIVALLTSMLLPSLSKSKAKAQRVSVLNNLRQLDLAKQQWALENKESSEATPTFHDIEPYLGRSSVPAVADETYVLGKVGEPPVAELDASAAKKRFGRLPPSGERTERVRLSSSGELAYVDKAAAENRQFTTGLTRPDATELRVNLATESADASPPALSPPAQIVLPPLKPAQLAGANAGNGVALRDNPALGINRGYSASAGESATGLPVAASEFGMAPDGIQDSEKDLGLYNNLSRSRSVTPVPPNGGSGVAGTPPPASVAVENLGEELKNNATPAYRSRYGLAQSESTNPRVAVSGGMADGGGGPVAFSGISTNFVGELGGTMNALFDTNGADAGKNQSARTIDQERRQLVFVTPAEADAAPAAIPAIAQPPPQVRVNAEFAETAPADNKAPASNLYLGDSVAAKAKSDVAGQADAVTSINDGQSAPEPTPGTVVTVSGRAFTNSVADGFYADSMISDGGRIGQEPGVQRADVVGYSDVTSKATDSGVIAVDESVRREANSIGLQGLPTILSPRSQVASEGKKPASDSQLTAGLRNKETLLAKSDGADQQLAEVPADLQTNRAYAEKQRELQDLTDFRRLLTRKMNLEAADLSLPKSSQVEIVELAEAKSAPSQTLWGTIRSAVSGDVERAVRIKLEPDKLNIALLDNGRGFNSYDPYFLQTEFEIIQSEAVLGKAVSQLGLDKTWAGNRGVGDKLKISEAVALLRKRLDLRAVPNSTLIEIRAKADKPDEAAKLANAVAEAYQQWRVEQAQTLAAGGLASLKQAAAEQDEKIRQTKAELEQLREVTSTESNDVPLRRSATNAPIPQPEVQTSENNFSTFSLNVSDVSFKLAAASLEKGQMPDPASIRSEEFINAFDYRDPEPAAGAPVAFAWERARYPFAHNRDLLRFSLKTAAAGRQAGRPLNIVLLLDNSGSMERADRVCIIREALKVLAAQLQPQDKLSVITFARTARLVADGISGDKAGEVTDQVGGLTPEGGTNLEDAMNLAYETAAKHYLANGINRVVLLTDGAANLGDVEPGSLKQKVEAARQQGIALDCFGIGWEGFNDDLLEVLSRNGDGRYGFLNSPEEAATDFAGQLAGALKVAASDVKVQVEFNPQRVTTYRQIGYAKHQLTKEQFRDNTVDAAEIAAQEAGNALYTVEVNPAGSGPLCTVRVRYKIPGTTDYREQAWDVPYTGNAPSLEQASPAMRLAASASAFSEWLAASPFAGEVSPDALLGYLRGVPEVFGADERPKKLEWMIRQAKSIAGK